MAETRGNGINESRRRFLMVTAGIGAGAVLHGLGMRPALAGPDTEGKLHERRGIAFGTDISIAVVHDDAEVARVALNEAMSAIGRVEDLFTLYRPESPLCRLNRDGVLEKPDPSFISLLKTARAMSEQTDGAFDATVQPLWALFERCRREFGRLPTDEEVSAARALVDFRAVEVSEKVIRFTRPGMALTLNGIAQGFATDQALAALKTQGIQHALVNAGELAANGTNAQGKPWQAGVQNPRRAEALLATLPLDGRALATSGDYESVFSDDRRHHHIFDPKTGHSPLELSSVSVLAPNSMQADAISTALFVMGVEKGKALLEKNPEYAALFVLKDGTVIRTPGFPA